MIHIRVREPVVMDMLRGVYANRLNAASRQARYAMNRKKRDFMEAFRLSSKVTGEPVDSDAVMAVYHFCIPRADWDAGVKSVQDACETYLGCKNDRVIKAACCFVTRPGKAKGKRPERERGLDVYFFCIRSELELALERVRCLSQYSALCWL